MVVVVVVAMVVVVMVVVVIVAPRIRELESFEESQQAYQPDGHVIFDPGGSSSDDQVRPGPVDVRSVETLELAATLTDPKPLAFIGWRAVDGLTPHWLRMIANAETANRRPWHIEKTVSNDSTLEVRAVLLQGARPRG